MPAAANCFDHCSSSLVLLNLRAPCASGARWPGISIARHGWHLSLLLSPSAAAHTTSATWLRLRPSRHGCLLASIHTSFWRTMMQAKLWITFSSMVSASPRVTLAGMSLKKCAASAETQRACQKLYDRLLCVLDFVSGACNEVHHQIRLPSSEKQIHCI